MPWIHCVSMFPVVGLSRYLPSGIFGEPMTLMRVKVPPAWAKAVFSTTTPSGFSARFNGMLTATYFSSALFMPMRVAPMAKHEASTPANRLICCARGVAPTRNPVLRSWEVLPPFAAAMQTLPPIIRASAP